MTTIRYSINEKRGAWCEWVQSEYPPDSVVRDSQVGVREGMVLGFVLDNGTDWKWAVIADRMFPMDDDKCLVCGLLGGYHLECQRKDEGTFD